MNNSTSVEELKEESNLIIYIVGLILLIIWKVILMCQVRLHWKHKRLEELVQRLYNRIQHLSSRSLILVVEQYV